ncbi:MAG: hypothetical protein CO029_00445 [Candidatus Magasanikbacteria bacterium CG_4_9_14_0_2_um_filter_41_10]|uniref:Uncharacterized protein n=1 Tax=Candidatus Magasanikbacteria bacterium CG_4_10_14_0_2_um_filter_41_31 TaxID=1974639 RepID=A0A2M7V3J0_9BACT|nr:MAG: hypothetical protein AUJ37_04280 [Candidatus Magasanikbacteria bacterium CG1_02_41_34]PIZ93044.1 MAG: hypothetical protein COX83_02830 [Candidatus Magasanikbacteria bacterium CG_4_10_14_0_2_um_filter_41_31]PJC53885.1 MAG: hypothetical protein CO029_00445 [Candidatus Magasanikbacteria bacterium CG_4_9_14_0_2_um_filter_41_10]
MFGFKKKNKKKNELRDLGVQMHTIPDVFYGGNDPVIYHNEGIDQKDTNKGTQKKKYVSKSGLHQHIQTQWMSAHKKILIWIGSALVLIAVTAVASWYYINEAKKLAIPPIIQVQKPPEQNVQIQIAEPLEIPVITTSTLDATTTEDIAAIKAIDPVSFPRILLINSEDTDADQLTNEEELLFNTNPDEWDTDKDGYYDGQEIINLYNASGFAPVKLIDSGVVSEYISPTWQYRLYYPQQWQIGTVDTEERQVLASTLSGDFVEFRVFDRLQGQSFQEWFAANIEGETFQDIQTITNRFKEQVFLRRDGLVAYVMASTHVTVLIYHPGITGAVPYRTVMRMMVESFRPTANTIELPNQQALPTPPGQGDSVVTTPSTTEEALVPVSS